jgi:4-alpha-glucanotransferase
VEDEVRDELADRAILSYRLEWFEDGPPPTFPRQALAGVTTHDLPTMAGVWSGADLADRRRLGRAGDGSDDTWFRSRIHQATGLDDDASTEEVVVATHEALAEAPSLIVVATLDDAVGMVDRPNLPGTIDEWPNWRIPLHRTLEEIESDPLVLAVADALDRGIRHEQPVDLPSPP